MWMHEPWYGFPWMWIFPLFFFIVILLMIFMVFGRGFRPPWHNSGGHRDEGTETALDILKKRYAKGEISKEEFERMKKDILS